MVAAEGGGAQDRLCRRSRGLRRVRCRRDRGHPSRHSNPPLTLPSIVKGYPGAVAQAVSRFRLAGVNGPYALLLGTEPYTAIGGGTDEGYPVLHHIQRLVDGKIIWAPAIEGGVVLTTRGGDFDLTIGQDISIGYLSHSETTVRLYFQETITFLMLTTEASVVLAPGTKKSD